MLTAPDSMFMKILLIAVFGGIGAITRFGVSSYLVKLTGGHFPWGTVAVNLIGCFLFGLVTSLARERHLIHPTLQLYILTGFMGALTTFSTFAFESVVLMDRGNWFLFGLNVAGQVTLGILAIMFGLWLGKASFAC